MTKDEFARIEAHMLALMNDSAHDPMHIYRVLYLALEIAGTEPGVDMDILIAACLLHDIGREAQSQDLALDHADIGGEMAHAFLTSIGWDGERADRVRACVKAHRYRKGEAPGSIEGRILFDADKLDVTGAIGMARTLIYGGQVTEPLYALDGDGRIITEGGGAEVTTFFQECNYKVRERVYQSFHTQRARQIAEQRRPAAQAFYDNLHQEIQSTHAFGAAHLRYILE